MVVLTLRECNACKTKGFCNVPDEDVTVFDEDDEEAGGFSIEAGYEKDGKYAKIKYEKDD